MSVYTDQLTAGLVSSMLATRDPMNAVLLSTFKKELVHKDFEITDLTSQRIMDLNARSAALTKTIDELKAEQAKTGVDYSATIAQHIASIEELAKLKKVWFDLQGRATA